jgi:hypothetical protein
MDDITIGFIIMTIAFGVSAIAAILQAEKKWEWKRKFLVQEKMTMTAMEIMGIMAGYDFKKVEKAIRESGDPIANHALSSFNRNRQGFVIEVDMKDILSGLEKKPEPKPATKAAPKKTKKLAVKSAK